MSPKTSEKKQPAAVIKVRQVRSGIGCPREMRETLRALGLRRMHQVVERHDTREIRGMIAAIPHLVEVLK
jgi:large subunit ribosomal protein L30